MLIPFGDDFPTIVYFDYSEMELRIQAEYTMVYKQPDKTLINAYIPYETDPKL